MAKKKLIAGGCSYTAANYISFDTKIPKEDRIWTMWPEHLGNRMDLDVINTGVSGSDNLGVFTRTVDKILNTPKDQIGLVVVLWTESGRSTHFNSYPLGVGYLGWEISLEKKNGEKRGNINFSNESLVLNIPEQIFNWWNNDIFKAKKWMNNSINLTLSYMATLASLCESMNIPYMFGQALPIFDAGAPNFFNTEIKPRPDDIIKPSDVFLSMHNNSYFKILEKKKRNIMGWPLVPEAGGSNIEYFMQQDRNHKLYGLEVSEIDKHPNAKGQKIISDMIHQSLLENKIL